MSKLRTPVMFEKAIAGLNEVFPLTLQDEVRQGLSAGILNRNPVSSNRPVEGRFARCNRQGGLLKEVDFSFINYQILEGSFTDESPEVTLTFLYNVCCVIVRYNKTVGSMGVFRSDNTFTLKYAQWYDELTYNFVHVGKKVYFFGEGDPVWTADYIAYGFY